MNQLLAAIVVLDWLLLLWVKKIVQFVVVENLRPLSKQSSAKTAQLVDIPTLNNPRSARFVQVGTSPLMQPQLCAMAV